MILSPGPYHPLQLPQLPDGFPPRYGHSITAVELVPGLIEVTVFGGVTQYDSKKSLDHQAMVAETTIMSFGMLANCHLCSVVYEYIIIISN